MSIYATRLYLGDFEDSAGKQIGNPEGPPWIFQGSHILPSVADKRGGVFGINAIPNHVTREGREDGGPGLHDWLQVFASDGHSDVDLVLNRAQVIALRRTLTRWLNRSPDPRG